jgi:CheY-like chemotaxis protein
VFTICFPALSTIDSSNEARPHDWEQHTARKTVLVVEDDPMVRRSAVRILAGHGYDVVDAESGPDAIRQATSRDERISVVLTDVVMPGMSGRELVEALRADHPSIAAVFMSGYTDDEVMRRGHYNGDLAFLAKPFTSEALLQAVATAFADVLRRE